MKPLQVWNFDQKPFHKNKAGSKSLQSLEFRGAGNVSIKDTHAQTRERWTACTVCVSNKQRAATGPPLEIMFKGGEGILRSCEDFSQSTHYSKCPN